MVKYAGGLHKDEINRMMTSIWQDGKPVEEVVIAMPHNVWDFLNFLASEYPEIFQKWLAAHAPEDKLIHVKWAEKVYLVASRSGGSDHVITQQGDRWACTCQGYGWRGTCWAITQTMQSVGGNV